MKAIARVIAFTFLFVFAFAVAADKATVAELLNDPAKFDGKVLTVTGKAKNFKAKTSKAGNNYFTFQIEEKGKTINVYGRGELAKAPKDGEKVEATGKFAKEKDMKSFTVKNELDVSKVSGEKGSETNGVRLLDK